MKLSQKPYIIELIECGSFSKAAKKLNISQPALSAYLTTLENKLNCKLVDRSATPIGLTPSGEAYVSYLKNVGMLKENLAASLEDIRQLNSGSISIGGAGCFTSGLITVVTSQFLKEYPNIDIRIVDGRIPELMQKLFENVIDLMILPTSACNENITHFELMKEEIFLAVPPEWDFNSEHSKFQIPYEDICSDQFYLKGYPGIDFSELSGKPFVLLDEGLEIRRISESFFKQYGVVAGKTVITSQITTGLSLTMAGVGISFITENALRFCNLKQMPILYSMGGQCNFRSLSFAYKKGKYVSSALEKYITFLKDINIYKGRV